MCHSDPSMSDSDLVTRSLGNSGSGSPPVFRPGPAALWHWCVSHSRRSTSRPTAPRPLLRPPTPFQSSTRTTILRRPQLPSLHLPLRLHCGAQSADGRPSRLCRGWQRWSRACRCHRLGVWWTKKGPLLARRRARESVPRSTASGARRKSFEREAGRKTKRWAWGGHIDHGETKLVRWTEWPSTTTLVCLKSCDPLAIFGTSSHILVRFFCSWGPGQWCSLHQVLRRKWTHSPCYVSQLLCILVMNF